MTDTDKEEKDRKCNALQELRETIQEMRALNLTFRCIKNNDVVDEYVKALDYAIMQLRSN
ncbi:MAG: hypothetical protein Q8Q23_00280 [bacterium]|nr:hypothetical protein [bacterium]